MSNRLEAATHATLARQAGTTQAVILVVTAFLPILAIVSMTAAVPTILDRFRDVPSAKLLVPLIVSAPGLTIALLAPFAGMLVDRFGRRTLLLWATALYGFAGASPFFLNDIYAILGTRLALGVAEAAILTIVNTLIGDYWDQPGRRRVLLLQGLAGPVFGTSVIAVSGVLTELRWNGVFLIYLIAFPIFVAMLLWVFEPRGDRRAAADGDAPVSTAFPTSAVASFALVTLFASTLYYVFVIQGGLAFREVGVTSPAELGGIISLASLAVPVGALIFGLVGTRPAALQLFLFLLLIGGGLAAIGLAGDRKAMFAGLIVQQLGAGMAVPVLLAWAQSKLPFEHRGRGMGIWTCAFFLGQFSSPLVVGLVRGAERPVQYAFLVLGLLGVAGAVLALRLLLRGVRGAPASLPA